VLSNKKKYRYVPQVRSVLSGCMMFLLLVLTSANFLFYFSQADDTSIVSVMVDDDDPDTFPGSPSGPDEKAPGGPVSFAEEFLHDHEDDYLPLIPEGMFTHVIAESEKVELVHFELLSPPPEC
jgi:hypothetical protein